MSNIDIIRAEIGKHLDALNKVKHLAAFAEEHGYNHGFEDAMRDLLSFLDTLEESKKCDGCNNVKGCVTCVNGDQWAHYEESEKPMQEDLEKEAVSYCFDNGINLSPRQAEDFARHFTELGRKIERTLFGAQITEKIGYSEKPNNHLEHVPEIKETGTQVLDEVATKLYPDVWFPQPADGLVQSRQKERNAFKAGAEWDREQMMKDAVEGTIAERRQGKLYARCQVPKTMGVEFGDRVRIIIVKED